MEFINKLEATVVGWVKNVPHLPVEGQKWLAQNVWWIVLIGAIASGLATLVTLIALLGGGLGASYVYVIDPAFATWLVVTSFVKLVFFIIVTVLFALAITPLKALQKKGWVLLFIGWLVEVVYSVVAAILTLSVLGFIGGILVGALGAAIGGYFLFEIHGQFAHSRKVKAAKSA